VEKAVNAAQTFDIGMQTLASFFLILKKMSMHTVASRTARQTIRGQYLE